MIVTDRKVINNINEVTEDFTGSDTYIAGGRIKHNRITGFKETTIIERFETVLRNRLRLLGATISDDTNTNISTLKEHGEIYIVRNAKNNQIYIEITLK